MDPRTVIQKLQVTEKGTVMQGTQNKYFFRVDPKATKHQIKGAIEQLFGVKVARVNTMRYEGKLKRERTARYGRRNDWKRAVVTLGEGSKIELV
jgi:large subunit ribosomal protein L23